HGERPALHEALVGARPPDRLRAHVHPPVRRLRRCRREGQAAGTHVPRRPGDRLRDRRDPQVGKDQAVGEGWELAGQIPSSKSQAPRNAQIPTPKPTPRIDGSWSLGVRWDLGFGAWDLRGSKPKPTSQLKALRGSRDGTAPK